MREMDPPRTTTRPRLGDLLVNEGLVSEQEITAALAEQQETGERLGRILVAHRVISEVDLVRSLSRQFGLDFVDLDEQVPDFTASRLVRESFARRHRALAIGWEGKRLVVAMVNPVDVFALDDIRSMTGHDVKPVMAEPSQLTRAIDRVWSSKTEDIVRQVTDSIDEPAVETSLGNLREAVDDAPVVMFVNELITRAVDSRASDIHLEPGERELRIRFRVDGVLHDVMTVPRAIQASVVSRLKVMAEIDIAERRLPQDGRMTLSLPSSKVDLRLVTLPTAQGEALVIRILDRSSGLLSIEELGFLPETLRRYRESYRRPWGAVLVTGPTGSGKSTTLYASISALNDPQRGIITVEDPIEYRLPGIKQVQVNRKAGLTFSNALRSILRADPDVVLVGEIRDQETATIAIEAALTGHLVLTTLHTNDAASTPARLLDMGLEPFLVTSAVTSVLAQRLVRRLCKKCRQPCDLSKEELASAGWSEAVAGAVEQPEFYRAVGCGSCSNSGYRGRFAVQEVMLLSDEIAHLVASGAASETVRAVAVEQGMVSMRDDGLRKVAAGHTTLEELLRVTV